jgi:hypothetical protein
LVKKKKKVGGVTAVSSYGGRRGASEAKEVQREH